MSDGRICLYYRTEPDRDRWVPGDRFLRPFIRRIVRGKPSVGGVEKVFINLCLGLEKLAIPYKVNLPFRDLNDDDRVGVLGRGRFSLEGYHRSNPIVAGIGLMAHPSEWPNLCDDHPVARYLQHSKWANDVYSPYFGRRCTIWPVGIDTDEWAPGGADGKVTDFLVYDKIRWDYDRISGELMHPLLRELEKRKLSYEMIRYGRYGPEDFKKALRRCRAMVFLCEHESQGLAYQECLSSGLPILAWDQGWCLDPDRFKWGQAEIPATSVPFFDSRCGETFHDIGESVPRLDRFVERLNRKEYRPRDYILENLTLEKCSAHFYRLLTETNVA